MGQPRTGDQLDRNIASFERVGDGVWLCDTECEKKLNNYSLLHISPLQFIQFYAKIRLKAFNTQSTEAWQYPVSRTLPRHDRDPLAPHEKIRANSIEFSTIGSPKQAIYTNYTGVTTSNGSN